MIKRCVYFIIFLGAMLMIGIGVFTDYFEFCKREMELMPGVRLEYYSDQHSRLIWDDFGIIADGDFHLGFWDYGLCVFSTDVSKSRYLDLLESRLVKGNEVLTVFGKNVNILSSTDVQTAMGIYTNYGKKLFMQDLNELKDRLQKARRRRD